MSLTSVVVIVLLILLAAYAVLLYNALVRLKHGVSKAWSNIDVMLKQRHDELLKLVETCKQYMQHERGTLETVISARQAVSNAQAKGDMARGVKRKQACVSVWASCFALAENYPELKANESFQHLQQRITGLENGIADRRELYNEAVNLNNVRIEQFPDVLVARVFAFKAAALLEFSEGEKADVSLKSLFG